MRTELRRALRYGTIGAALVIVVACGGGDDQPTSALERDAETVPPETATPAAAPTGEPALVVECPSAVFDARGRELVQSDFDDLDLRCAIFDDAVLAQVNFDGVDLSAASFEGASLAQVTFSDAVAVGASFEGADIAQSRFERSDFTGAALAAAVLVDLTWSDVQCPDATPSLDDESVGCLGALEPVAVEIDR